MEPVTQVLVPLVSFLFYASLKSTVLIVLILLVQKVLGRFLSANGRYLLWLTVVISLVTPIGFETVVPNAGFLAAESPPLAATTPATGASQPDAPYQGISSTAAPPDSLQPAAIAGNGASMQSSTAFPWNSTLPYLWLAGTLLVIGTIAVSCYRFSLLVRRAQPAPQYLQSLLTECLAQTGCKAGVRLLQSASIPAPMIAGLFKPVLMLPDGVEEQLTRDQLRHVVIHELMHLLRGDIVCNWIVALVQALHWFNPAIWLAFSFMRHDRELACDAATLRHLDPADRPAYGHTLLQLSEGLPRRRIPAHALGILESQSHLRRRILMLVQTSLSNRLQAVFAAILFIPLAAVAFSQPVSSSAEAVQAEPVSTANIARVAPVQAPQTVLPSVQASPSAAPAAPAATPVTFTTEAAVAVQAPSPVLQLAQVDDTSAVDAFEPDAGGSIVVAAITPEATAPVESHPDLSAIQQLAAEIAAIKAERISFIEEWDSIAADCEARSHRPFGNLIAPCRQIRMALGRGEILDLGIECYNLAYRHTELLNRYREAASAPNQSDIGSALQDNEQSLREFCSTDTYQVAWPAFAELFVRAQSFTATQWHDDEGSHRGGVAGTDGGGGYSVYGESGNPGAVSPWP